MAHDISVKSKSPVVADGSRTLFKAPAVPKKRIRFRKAKVLEEDIYLDRMGKIIERDFFPDLEKLKAQNDYLDALDKNDIIKLREIHAKYTSGTRLPTSRYSSPATFDTPIDARPQGEEEEAAAAGGRAGEESVPPVGEEPRPDRRISLDQYLGSHTSEDNHSFQDIIQESEYNHRQKHTWIYKQEFSNREALDEKLRVPSIEEQAAGKPRPSAIDSWGYKNRNYIMFVPDGVELTAEEKIEMAKRKQEIDHSNTALKGNPFDENRNKEKIQGLAQSQAKHLDGKIGVDGKELVSDTPKVNGYGLVKTPSPAPGVNESPLMTWGEIEGTPFRLDGGDTPLHSAPGPSFWIPEPPKRERLALKLADRVGERQRERKKKAVEAARRRLSTPGGGSSLEAMSPAARRFASAHLRSGLGSDKALIASYSPLPRSPSSSATPKSDHHHQGRTPTPHHNTLLTTDNLLNLNLPRRPRASDFFE